uniref:Methyltransferase type 11 domain-containing protein n=2 Tax=Rhizochromulina marina TaxID=1034831 RepID=A0A7S2RNG1_9STRA|mmetsp:Transcript_18785/g.54711  ORF Transcript_18785/g.54711 Transcript_18785/m.54711 type:complete len:348 (+) Transcript_18785:142-1185(+)
MVPVSGASRAVSFWALASWFFSVLILLPPTSGFAPFHRFDAWRGSIRGGLAADPEDTGSRGAAPDEDLQDQRPQLLQFFDQFTSLPRPKAAPYSEAYWADPRIHSFGNTGFLGSVHAGVAPIFTFALDMFAYKQQNIRSMVMDRVVSHRRHRKLGMRRAADIGCGTGTSTRALLEAGPFSEVFGVDTSAEMLSVARVLTFGEARATYLKLNGETTGLPAQSFDVVTIMFVFHEAPSKGRQTLLAEARRILAPDGELVVLDISPDYSPSPAMKSGEPYIDGYLANIQDELQAAGFESITREAPIPGRANLWVCKEPAFKTISSPPPIQQLPVLPLSKVPALLLNRTSV